MRAKLFVGNLNYETTTAKLETAFCSFQGYSHAKVSCAFDSSTPPLSIYLPSHRK